MPNKLTDAEIKKALEEYINFADLEYTNHTSIEVDILKNALDLINRQEGEKEKNENIIRVADKTIATLNAENESLKAEIERLQNTIAIFTQNSVDFANEIKRQKEDKEDAFRFAADMVNAEKIVIAEAKTEAYKEFVEKVKNYIDVGHLRKPTEICFSGLDVVEMLDNLLNELVGNGDGKRKD